MSLITEAYREQQRQLHENPDYGVASKYMAPMVAKIINANGITELLDYGAGKCVLVKTISEQRLVGHKFKYIPYEPSNPQWSATPEPAEMVVCIDVLEHIEPDLLDNVLDDLQRVTKQVGFFTVSTRPAMKTLPDGRNAHLIQEPAAWWLPKIMARFELHSFQLLPDDGFAVLVRPYELSDAQDLDRFVSAS